MTKLARPLRKEAKAEAGSWKNRNREKGHCNGEWRCQRAEGDPNTRPSPLCSPCRGTGVPCGRPGRRAAPSATCTRTCSHRGRSSLQPGRRAVAGKAGAAPALATEPPAAPVPPSTDYQAARSDHDGRWECQDPAWVHPAQLGDPPAVLGAGWAPGPSPSGSQHHGPETPSMAQYPPKWSSDSQNSPKQASTSPSKVQWSPVRLSVPPQKSQQHGPAQPSIPLRSPAPPSMTPEWPQ